MTVYPDLTDEKLLPTSVLAELEVFTDDSSFVLSLSLVDGERTEELFSQRYSPFNGSMSVYELDDVVQQYMMTRGANSAVIRLSVVSDNESLTADMKMVYCSEMAAPGLFGLFLERSFLTLQRYAMLPEDFDMHLYTVDCETPVEITVRCVNRVTGDAFNYEWSETPAKPANGFVSAVRICRASVNSDIYADHELLPEQFNVNCVSVRQGERSFTGYVAAALSMADSFRFCSSFNCMEHVSPPGVRSRISKPERQTASVLGVKTPYDLDVSESVAFQSGALPYFTFEAVRELCSASKVWAMRNGQWEPVTLTDVSCEWSDDNSKLNTVKFTYSFDTKRDRLAVPGVSDVFTKQFNPVFD